MTKSFYKIKATGVHGTFTFIAKLYDASEIRNALCFCLGNAFKIEGKASKTTAKEIQGLKSFDGVNEYYFVY